MVKVLNFGKYFPPVNGGIEAHAELLSDMLAERYEVTTLVHSINNRTIIQIRGSAKIIRLATQIKINTQPISFGMITYLFKNRFDIIHLHIPNVWTTILAGIFRKDASLIITHHSDILQRSVFKEIILFIYRRVVRNADMLLVMSLNNYTSSRDLSDLSCRVEVVPHAIDPDSFPCDAVVLAQAADIRRKYAGDLPLLVFVGRLVAYKGLDIVIRAAAQLGDIRVIVVGEGLEHKNLVELAKKLGVEEKFIFLGNIPESDKNATLRAADIFVFPSTSRAEAFGIAQVEAQICGLPIITTSLPTGVSDVTRHGETGFCVPPGDVDALARAIEKLIADASLRASFGKAGLARAMSHYVPSAVRIKLFAAYDHVLHKRNARFKVNKML